MAAFIIRAQLPDNTLEQLLHIMNLVATRDFVDNDVRRFLNQFNTTPSTKMYVCPKENCQVYLSPRPDANFFYCEICEEEFETSFLVQKRSFFSYLSVETQIAKILEDGKFLDYVENQRDDQNSNTLVNGRRYQSLVRQGSLTRQDFTLLLNTDGVQATVSSRLTLWPVQMCILEVPLTQRHKYVILPLVWLSEKKPKLNEIMIPLVKELRKLSDEGMQSALGQVRFHVVLCPVDCQARTMMTNLKQYNAAFSCVWCLTEGRMMEKGRGHARFFVKDLDAERRTTRGMLHHATLATNNNVDVFGVKGHSIMGELPDFDLVWGYNPEYLHNVCLGVVVTLLDIMTCPKFERRPFSIRANLPLIDSRLLKVTPTSEITRLPEKLSNFKSMKAAQLRNVLCYYLLPIIHDLSTDLVKNTLLLLVYGVRMYLQDTLTEEEENKASACIRKFCDRAPHVFHEHVCTYNLHIFSHIPETCREWGALWDSSTFSFESHNGFLMKLSHGTKYHTEQIMRNHQIYMSHVVRATSTNPAVNDMLESLRFPTRRLKTVKRLSGAALFGRGEKKILTDLEKIQLERKIADRLESTTVVSYTRFSCNNGILVHADDYKKLSLRVNCVFKTNENNYIAVKDLLVYKNQRQEESVILRCYKFYVTGFDFAYDAELEISSGDLFFTGRRGVTTHFLRLRDLGKKCVCFRIDDKIVLSHLVNSFERD